MNLIDILQSIGPFPFLVLLILKTVFTYFYNKPQHYGPNTYPIIGCIFAFYTNRHRLLHWYTELLATSPSQTIIIQRIGARRTIVTANPSNVEHIIKTNFYNYPKGKAFTEILGDLLGLGIFNVDGGLWHVQRKLISHEFTARAMRELLITTLESEAKERLLPILELASKESLVLDMQEVLKRFTFDITCRISLGKDPESLDPAFPISRLGNALDAASQIIAARGSVPVSAAWKIKRLLNLGKEKQLKEEIMLIHESIMEMIQNRKNEKGAICRKDFLSRLIARGFSDEVVRDMVISFIVAGRDTTASALTWFFWCMSQHQQIEEEVLNEVTFIYMNSLELV
jgi:jasmonoyl-L-amino acid 12-hydroxylase